MNQYFTVALKENYGKVSKLWGALFCKLPPKSIIVKNDNEPVLLYIL